MFARNLDKRLICLNHEFGLTPNLINEVTPKVRPLRLSIMPDQ